MSVVSDSPAPLQVNLKPDASARRVLGHFRVPTCDKTSPRLVSRRNGPFSTSPTRLELDQNLNQHGFFVQSHQLQHVPVLIRAYYDTHTLPPRQEREFADEV